jgi:hypothetical protein
MDIYNINLEALKKKDLELFNKMIDVNIDFSKYRPVKTKTDDYTLQIIDSNYSYTNSWYLHSKYNPRKEARDFIKTQIQGFDKEILIYGFGLGYHIKSCLEEINRDCKVYVVELNLHIFKLALLYNKDIEDILNDARVHLIISEDEKVVAAGIAKVINRHVKFCIHHSSIKVIPESCNNFRILLEKWELSDIHAEKWNGILEQNYRENIKLKCPNIGMFFYKYKDMPVIICSAGPSLNKNKYLLKKIKDKALIFAVGSALKPILETGVEPDLFCIIDPHEKTYQQIIGYEDIEVPFVFLDTACHKTVYAYKGPRYIVCNDRSHGVREDLIIESGGSVSTALMDIAIKLGGNPIVFVGQDLAYTDGKHHADSKMYGEQDNVKILPNMRKVKGQDGSILYTSWGMLTFKQWIEEKISKTSGVEFINATEGGAFIKGCRHITLQQFISQYIENNSKECMVQTFLKELINNSFNKSTLEVNIHSIGEFK